MAPEDTGRDSFVPATFVPPTGLVDEQFVLEPLGPEHNDSDHDAWASSIDHIRATPGWGGSSWPRPMSREENLADLERHARDFAERAGFTYTVLDPASREVVGCVYVYPGKAPGADADVHSWVRADRAALDRPLWQAVSGWLAREWPFERPAFAPRPPAG